MIGRCVALLAAVLGITVVGTAQQNRVIAAENGSPLVNATVRLLTEGSSVRTDGNGRFHFITPGAAVATDDTLLVSHPGYVTARLPWRSGVPLIVTLVRRPTVLEELVAVAGRREQHRDELITPITVVDREAIRSSGAMAVDQIVQEIPGIQQGAMPPAANTVSIRGIAGSRVLMLIDAERIEVARGPMSVIHGSQALGGVINLVTSAPSGPLGVGMSGSYGSRGRRNAAVDIGSGGTVAWRVTGSLREQARIAAQVERDGAQQRIWDGTATIRHASSSGQTIRADLRWFRERQRWPIGGGFFGFNDNHGIGGWTEGVTPLGSGTFRTRLSFHDYSHQYREAQSPIPYRDSGPPTQREQVARILGSHATMLGSHSLDVGLEFTRAAVTAADRLIGGSLSDRTAELWIQDAFPVGDFRVMAAARGSWSSRWDGTVTPSLSLGYDRGNGVRWRAGVARGFRGPTFKETGWNFSIPNTGYALRGNPDLRPETAWQTFVGATWQPSTGWQVDLEGYRNELVDMIELVLQGQSPDGLTVYRTENIDRARTSGVDLTVRRLTANGGYGLSWASLDAINRVTGERLPRRPPHAARLHWDHRLSETIGFATSLRWSDAAPGSSFDELSSHQGSFTSWDFQLRLAPMAYLDLMVGVDNILDHRPAGWQAAVERAVYVSMRTAVR